MISRMISTWFLLGVIVQPNEAKRILQRTTCSTSGVYECSEKNRPCELTKKRKENCGQCQLGYVEFNDYTTQARLPPCVEIANITWPQYTKEYEPVYRDAGVAVLRLGLLKESAKLSSEVNAKNQGGTFKLGLTPFSADTPVEYEQRSGYFYVNTSGTNDELSVFVAPTVANADLAPSIDWVADGAVTAVKNQGRCACSWAVGVCGAIEGAAYKVGKSDESISFQQLISCNKRNIGCDGGSTPIAVRYAAENWFGGVTTLEEYPFTDAGGLTTEVCNLAGEIPPPPLNVTNSVLVAGLHASVTFEKRLETFKLALMDKPISVILKSSCRLFSNYVSGILTDDGSCTCSTSKCYDHSVLMVGYNDTDETPYFKFKNSWGTKWGEDGYFRVSQKESGTYGLFGIFGEGVMVDVQTNIVSDTELVEVWFFPTWAIVTIALLGSLCCFRCAYIGCVCWSRNHK